MAKAKAKAKSKSLQAFVAAQRPTPVQCRPCLLPAALRKELDAGLNAGITGTAASAWLESEHKVKICERSIQRHKRRHIHE